LAHPISLSEAKAQLVDLVYDPEASDVVHTSRHDRPVAVLLSQWTY